MNLIGSTQVKMIQVFKRKKNVVKNTKQKERENAKNVLNGSKTSDILILLHSPFYGKFICLQILIKYYGNF